MNKFGCLIAGVALSALLTGCGEEKKPDVPDCVFPQTTTPAPAWICDGPVEGVEVSAVGSATKSAAGHSFMKQMAATDARVQLASSMKTHVKNMVKQYIETTGAGDTETVDKVMTSVSKVITSETLVGTKIFKSRTAPDGTLYVLLGMDEAAATKGTELALKTSMNNDKAMYQQFKSKKGQDELAAEIAKMNAQ